MTERGLKIATIGGGSSYTPELIEGFIKRMDVLPVKGLYLVDITEGQEKLNIVTAFAKRMVETAGADLRIHATTDREEALKDADFVTTQFRAGLLDSRIRDERIPLRYHKIGQETTDAGRMLLLSVTVSFAHPIQIGHTPLKIRGLLQNVKAYEQLTIQAAIYGDRDAALQALTIHPLVNSAETARLMLNDILSENQTFLPNFA